MYAKFIVRKILKYGYGIVDILNLNVFSYSEAITEELRSGFVL